MQTVTRTKIEILADAPLVPRIVAALEAAGIGGHTLLPALGGSGRTGSWSEDGLTGAQSKLMVVAIASTDAADALVDALGPLLTSHRLLLTVGEVSVVRGDRF